MSGVMTEVAETKFDLKVFDATKKKRRRVVAPPTVVEKEEKVEKEIPTPSTASIAPNAWLADDKATGKEREYMYVELLKRIYDVMQDQGNNEPQRRSIEPPEVGLVGTRRVCWVNFGAECRAINRSPQHVLDFVLTELGTTGDLGENEKLTIRGRFQAKQFENLLKKYIAEYVTCRTCKSPDTILKKENRLVFKVCQNCGSSSSVASIQSGFRAQTAAGRRAERQANQ